MVAGVVVGLLREAVFFGAVDVVRALMVEEVTLVPVRDADPVLIVDGTAAVPALDDDVATA